MWRDYCFWFGEGWGDVIRRFVLPLVIVFVSTSTTITKTNATTVTSATQNCTAHTHTTMNTKTDATTVTSATQDDTAHAHATIYVANTNNGTITPIDTATNT